MKSYCGLILFFLLMLSAGCMERKRNARPDTSSSGKASYYGDQFHGDTTASGDIYDQNEFTAAHRTLPFGTLVLVVNENTNKQVVVCINDRGPFHKKRIIDLSVASAMKIDMYKGGIAPVKILPVRVLEQTILDDSLMKDGDVRDCFGNEKKLSGHSIRLCQAENIRHAFYLASIIVLDDGIDSIYVKAAGKGRNRKYQLLVSAVEKKKDAVKLFNRLRGEGFIYAKPLFTI
jgi:rare lipoprotein A